MATWKLIKLKFGNSPVHFGELGIGMEESKERVRSDSLFSAWVSTYAQLFREKSENIESLLKQFEHNPPVRISSTFIYNEGKQGTIYYLPRPLQFPIYYPEDDLKFFKTYKGLNYLPLEVWQRWYQGTGFSNDDKQELIDVTNKEKSKYKALKNAGAFDYKTAFSTEKIPKIAVDRVSRATNLYHTAFVRYRSLQESSGYKSLSGLYFLLKIESDDKALIERLHAALILLGEQGIGGERSSGAGQFKVEWFDKLPEAWHSVVTYQDSKTYCLLSMFWDSDQSVLKELIMAYENNKNASSYEIQERGGWLAESNIRRKMVRMFAEGSVFPQEPCGKLINVTPKELINKDGTYKTHAIYRSGISFSLPIKTQV